MMNSNDQILVVGGGLTGLMSSIAIKKRFPKRDITLIERTDQLGGMYNSIIYSDDICFDYGMHVIYESCNPEIDDLYREVMPESEWNIYKENRKDIAGLFFNGKLQTFSHYIDLRTLPLSTRKRLIGSLMSNLNSDLAYQPLTAMEFLRSQFGEEITEEFHKPILKMMYGVNPESLDIFATKATAFERVILFDKPIMLDLMGSELLRSRLGFPDQLTLPPLRKNSQAALYPKKFGMHNFIKKLSSYAESHGIKILRETTISDIEINNKKIQNISLESKGQKSSNVPVSHLVWTTGWPALAKLLKVNTTDIHIEQGPEMVFVNLIFDRAPRMDDLYYFYCYDNDYASFRITNYSNYCPASCDGNKFPICVELWPSKIGKKKSELDELNFIQIAIDELKRFGVIDNDYQLLFSAVEKEVGEFPMPTINNTSALHTIRNRVNDIEIQNMSISGIMAEDGLFFIPDILNDAFSKLNRINI